MFKFIMGMIVGVVLYDMGPEFKQYFVESGSIDVAIEKLEDIKDESNVLTLINTENLVRKSIKEGMDPQEAYLKYSAF